MGDPKNLRQNGNMNNSTPDDRVIWEDGQWAIIEAGDCWNGLSRSKTRDSLGKAIQAPWDPNLTVAPGPKAVFDKDLVKVRLADLLAQPATVGPTRGGLPTPAQFKPTPVAPPSPFMKKPWDPGPMPGQNVPEFPKVCAACGGRYYEGLFKFIHQATEHDPVLKGECPGSEADRAREAKEQKRAAKNLPHQRWP